MRFNTIKIEESKIDEFDYDKRWDIYCGGEQIGIVKRFIHGTHNLRLKARCFFKGNRKGVESLEDAVEYIKNQFDIYVNNIIREDI